MDMHAASSSDAQKLCLSCAAGMLATGGLLGINDGFGGLSLNTNVLAAPGTNDQHPQHIGVLNSKPFTSEQLARNSLTSVGTNTSSTTMSPSLSFSQGVSQSNGLPFGWMSMADPEGRVFYFNSMTGVAQWSVPLTQ